MVLGLPPHIQTHKHSALSIANVGAVTHQGVSGARFGPADAFPLGGRRSGAVFLLRAILCYECPECCVAPCT